MMKFSILLTATVLLCISSHVQSVRLEHLSTLSRADGIEDERTIVLVSNDNKRFTLSRKAAMMSEVVEMVAGERKENSVDVPLENVPSEVLSRIVEYLKHHNGKAGAEGDAFDAKFVEMPHEHLFSVIAASNYMSIEPLLDLTAARVASLIAGKTPQQIRDEFGIENDFTPEEEEEIKKENAWAFD